jgi:hypothetical protein
MKKILYSFLFTGINYFAIPVVYSQPEVELVKKVKAKLDKVNDYQVDGKMTIDVSFIKARQSDVKIFFKKPDKFKVKKEGGISILPKGGVSINLSSIIMTDNYTVIPAGEAIVEGVKVKIVKLLPLEEAGDVVLTTLYIDEKNLVIRKSTITTRESGTYEMQMAYGRYIEWGLPDKVVFSFNIKDYKLPKGVTFEYDSGNQPSKEDANKNKKGKVEIMYANYVINKGVSDDIFK